MMPELNDLETQKIKNLLRNNKPKDINSENWFINRINQFRKKMEEYEIKPNEN